MIHVHGSSNMHDVFIQTNDEYFHIGIYVSVGLEAISKENSKFIFI